MILVAHHLQRVSKTLSSFLVLFALSSLGTVSSAQVMSPDVTRATRELQQLQQDIDRHRRDDAIENMRKQEFDSDALPSVSVPAPQGRHLFHLKALEHTPSSYGARSRFG